MMENREWKEYILSDVIDKFIDYRGRTPKKTDFGIPLITAKVVKKGRLLEPNEFIAEEDYEDWMTRGFPKFNDVILTSEAPLGEVALVKDEKIALAQRIITLQTNKDICNSIFLKYYFQSYIGQNALQSRASGSTVEGIKSAELKKVEIQLPPLPEQKAIASVLSSLDDKIDLLHQQNQTLEALAETLFRQWFIEEAKEDWEEGILDDILSVKGGTTPSTNNPSFWNGNIHWTTPRDITTLNGIYLFDTERKITELGLSKISSGLLPKGTLLMTSRAPVGVLAFTEVPIAINQGYIAILDNKQYSKEFIYLWLKCNIDYVHSFSNGSTFMEISKSAFKSLKIQKPPVHLTEKFQKIIEPIFIKLKLNSKQIQTLTKLRDTLLPKLMSGEVRVKN